MPTGADNPLIAGVDLYNQNRNIRDFTSRQDDLLGRGDFMSTMRPELLERYRQFLLDPSSALKDSGYQDYRADEVYNTATQQNALGNTLSGNVLKELQKTGARLDFQRIDEERKGLLSGITASRPEVGAALRNLPDIYRARQGRDASTGRFLQSLSGTARDWWDRLIRGLVKPEDIPEEVRGEFSDADPNWADSDELIRTGDPTHDADWWGGTSDTGDDTDYWDWIFGGEGE